MYRQPKGQKLIRTTVQIDEALLAALDSGAAAQGLSRSAALSQLLRKVLPAQPKQGTAA